MTIQFPGAPPRAVFFGSPAFAVPFLEAVAQVVNVVGVVTQPDRAAGRGRALAEPAVKVAARRLNIPVIQPERVRAQDVGATLRALDADLFIVVAYGRILPQALLDVPRRGCWNVHGSLLPKLRGAAPIQWAIIRGERTTGVAVMRMEAGLDTGPVAAVAEVPIGDDDTTASLALALAAVGAPLLVDTLPAILDGSVRLTPQDDAAATLAPPLVKDDGRLRFDVSARDVSARARGCDPWPGATALLDGEIIRLFGPRVLSGPAGGAAGTVIGVRPEGLAVACADAPIAFAELQLPGRRRMPAAALLAGRPIPAGTSLQDPEARPRS
ncbi:MAG TPA: methionyl-tRNA formyltransferase [Polyangia bacterium]|nr:methionyl-tRNA formyltransferase [Polyangia bacterium]